MPEHAHTAVVARRVGRVLTALAAVVVLAAIGVGGPWLLATGIGWPLPERVPTSIEDISGWLTTPFDGDLLLKILACVAWVFWALFILDLVTVTADAIHAHLRHRPRRVPRGPLHAVVGVLVGAVIAAIITTSTRSLVPAAPNPTPLAQPISPPAVAAGSVENPRTPRLTIEPAATVTLAGYNATTTADATGGNIRVVPTNATYLVKPGDNLWNIAETTLGDPWRWHDIYDLNRGRTQTDGCRLEDPDLIHPGWVLRLPTPANPVPPVQQPGAPSTPDTNDDSVAAPETEGSPQEPTNPVSPAESTPESESAPEDTGSDQNEIGLPSVNSGSIIGAGLAAMLLAAIGLAVAQRRRRYRPQWPSQPSSGEDLAPQTRLITQLAAHDVASRNRVDSPVDANIEANIEANEDASDASPGSEGAPPAQVGTTESGSVLSIEDLLAHGRGLTGPGAEDAARAILVTALSAGSPTTPDHRARVITTRTDWTRLSGHVDGDGLWPRLTLADTTAAALDAADIEILSRRRILDQFDADTTTTLRANHPDAEPLPTVVVLLDAAPAHRVALHTIAESGQCCDVLVLTLGPHTPFPSFTVDSFGQLSTVDESQAEPRHDERLSMLTLADTTDAITTLRTAAGNLTHDDLWADIHDQLDDAPVGDVSTQDTPDTVPDFTKTREEREDNTVDVPVASSAPAQEPNIEAMQQDTAPVLLRLFGAVSLHANAKPIRKGVRTASLDVATQLALHRHGRSLDQLLDALYPHLDPRKARPHVRTAINSLRLVLRAATNRTDAVFILYDRTNGLYQFNENDITVDLWQFDTLLDHAARSTDDVSDQLDAAVDLYRGDLADTSPHSWILPARENAHRRVLDAYTRLAQLHEDHQPELAVHYLERAIAIAPANERLCQHLMRLYGTLGRPDAIQHTLARLRTHLDTLDADLDDETLAVAAEQRQA